MRTTKIVVEEASSPELSGTFTFHPPSRKSEFRVEEVESSLNTSRLENETAQLEGMITETVDASSDQQSKSLSASRQVSIVSVTSDENKTEDGNDDAMEDLLSRIKKQRSDLENILGIERKEEEEKIAKKQKKAEKAIEKNEIEVKEGIFHPRDFYTTIKLLYSLLFFYSNSKKNSLHKNYHIHSSPLCFDFSIACRLSNITLWRFFEFSTNFA